MVRATITIPVSYHPPEQAFAILHPNGYRVYVCTNAPSIGDPGIVGYDLQVSRREFQRNQRQGLKAVVGNCVRHAMAGCQ